MGLLYKTASSTQLGLNLSVRIIGRLEEAHLAM